jgi:hypothetical protein
MMDDISGRHARLVLAPGSGAPGDARDFLLATCRNWDVPRYVESGCVAVSELVTNAVLHAGTEIRVDLSLAAVGGLTLAVHDTGPGEPEIVPLDQRLLGGRGLSMVAKVSEEWGVEQEECGKSVWCRLTANEAS